MPLLLCPNDNSPMQTVKRAAVEFDMWGQVSFYECVGCPGVRYA